MTTNERSPLDAQFLRLHIRSTLQLAGMWSVEAEELLMGTCAQESHLGKYRRQLGGGPGTGIYQMEPTTEASLWADHIAYKPLLASRITSICGVYKADKQHLEHNLAYQHIMCRLRYRVWVKDPIPLTLAAQAQYWKDHYNTKLGAGKPSEYIDNYHRFVVV